MGRIDQLDQSNNKEKTFGLGDRYDRLFLRILVKKSIAKQLNVKPEDVRLAARNLSLFICFMIAIYVMKKLM